MDGQLLDCLVGCHQQDCTEQKVIRCLQECHLRPSTALPARWTAKQGAELRAAGLGDRPALPRPALASLGLRPSRTSTDVRVTELIP